MLWIIHNIYFDALVQPFVPLQSALQKPNIATKIIQNELAQPFVPPNMPNKGPTLTQHSLQNESQMKSFRLVYFGPSKMAQLTPHIAQHWPNLAIKWLRKNLQLKPLPVGSCLFLLTRDQSGYVGPFLGMFGGTNGFASAFWVILWLCWAFVGHFGAGQMVAPAHLG